jgi:hypothetical protein
MCARTIFDSLLVLARSVEWFANGCQSEDPNCTGNLWAASFNRVARSFEKSNDELGVMACCRAAGLNKKKEPPRRL